MELPETNGIRHKHTVAQFIILEMHPLAAASRSRLTVRNVLLYMRSHGSALNLSLRQT